MILIRAMPDQVAQGASSAKPAAASTSQSPSDDTTPFDGVLAKVSKQKSPPAGSDDDPATGETEPAALTTGGKPDKFSGFNSAFGYRPTSSSPSAPQPPQTGFASSSSALASQRPPGLAMLDAFAQSASKVVGLNTAAPRKDGPTSTTQALPDATGVREPGFGLVDKFDTAGTPTQASFKQGPAPLPIDASTAPPVAAASAGVPEATIGNAGPQDPLPSVSTSFTTILGRPSTETSSRKAGSESQTASSARRATGKSSLSGQETQSSATAASGPSGLPGLIGFVPINPVAVQAQAAAKGGPHVESASGKIMPSGPETSAQQGLPLTADQTSGDVAGSGTSVRSSPSTSKNEDFASLAPIVKSVSVETQLAPSVQLSPMQQVIDTVRKLAAAPASEASPAAAVTTQAVPISPSRAMTIVLEPDNLGTVTVRMQLRGDSLDLQLDVANSQTLNLLSKDKDSLTAAMSSQDYQIGTLTLRASDTQTSSQGSDHGSSNQDQTAGGSAYRGDDGSRHGQSSPSDGSGQMDGGRGGQPQQRANASKDKQTPDRQRRAAAVPDSGNIYI